MTGRGIRNIFWMLSSVCRLFVHALKISFDGFERKFVFCKAVYGISLFHLPSRQGAPVKSSKTIDIFTLCCGLLCLLDLNFL